MEILGIVAALAVCAGMLWLASRIEPHWVSRDGTRFTCVGQQRTDEGRAIGRWREVRVVVGSRRAVALSRRGVLGARSGAVSTWDLVERSTDAPKGKAVYLLADAAGLLAIRVPAKSRCVPVLDARLATGAEQAPSEDPVARDATGVEPSPGEGG